ncbi:DNA translocase FtsK [Jeotgalibacillus haloalkalitolerans]|uniref:DNA translocase FtsK n=1 Tax=Jeotgalibacillus haloalkalitolerans TaxID=3104292 RepID=A0ABU5KMM4_9BACL|nr:DNA translocase FtsK [Jeotgalibacillus sp. HH7-29]MDZ5712509.1 DNA translocase FtsK [Jeotgalibacillus sp. HH7-29]
MNWIQKLLSFVQRQEEDEIERDTPIKKENRKDLQTRVSYQYPKGEFRFPLIPDESSQKKEREPKKEAVPEKSRIIEKSPNAGPFKPTDVPSPIYGFRDRPKKIQPLHNTEEVEYEISSFQELKRKIAADKKQDQAGQAAEVLSFEELRQKNEPPVVTQTDEPESNETDYEQPEEKAEVREEESPEAVPGEKQEEPVLAVEETAQAQEAEDQFVREEENVSLQHASETQEVDHNEELSQSEEQIEPLKDRRPEEQAAEPAAEEKPKAGRVPFNVMMLKQDRRKRVRESYNNDHDHKEEPPAEPEQPDKTQITAEEELPHFMKPSLDLLSPPVHAEPDQEWLDYQAELLNETLFHFNVNATVKNVTQGPSVTRFELFPEKGVKVSKITSLTDDIKLGLAARDIRMEAPIPGKMAVGIEIPNPHSRPVAIKEILADEAFQNSEATLPVALGLDIEGKPVVTDISKMPHGLIAGATGSGKSVCINSILISLMYHASPDDVKMLLIDPKVVELAPYNHIPHLVSPVITDVKAATAALKWAVEEMERRYQLFAHAGVRDIKRYNHKVKNEGNYSQKLPYLVVVIDELADLMMMSPADVEEAICRIAQKARACGIHLLIATQRPSVDVITGLIKANVPTRIAFSVSSQVDSRTIIDSSGAERLLGRGDMLFLENGASKPVRLQGTFVSDDEIDEVAAHVRNERKASYLFEQEELLAKVDFQDEEDELLTEACEFVIAQGGASTSLLQRQFRIGYNRAARLIDMMEKNGWISESKGSKPRDVLMAHEDLSELQDAARSVK